MNSNRLKNVLCRSDITMIYIFVHFQNFSTLSYRYCRLLAVIALCLSDVVFVSYHIYKKGNLGPKISLSAHASGAIAGLLLGFIIFSTSKETTNYYRHISLILCCVFVIIFPFFTI